MNTYLISKLMTYNILEDISILLISEAMRVEVNVIARDFYVSIWCSRNAGCHGWNKVLIEYSTDSKGYQLCTDVALDVPVLKHCLLHDFINAVHSKLSYAPDPRKIVKDDIEALRTALCLARTGDAEKTSLAAHLKRLGAHIKFFVPSAALHDATDALEWTA